MAFGYAEALPDLAAHGLVPGPDGLDPADLVAAAAARGWSAQAERVPTAGALRWRATVFAPRGSVAPPGTMVTGTTRRGATEAEALALALASMLRREG